MATPAQQPSPARGLPMSVKKLTSSSSIMSYPPLLILKHNVLVINGDMNAQICQNVNHKFSLHNSSNRNMEHLENRLTCLNTKFQKRKSKLWTYTYANNTKAQIDYVFINKKWNNCALNCEVYASFEGLSSDHWNVTAKIRLSLRRKALRTTITEHYDWSLLNNRDIAKNYWSITFISKAAKIYNVQPRNRTEPKIEKILWKNQYGFRRNRSTTSQILTVRWFLKVHVQKTERQQYYLSTSPRPFPRVFVREWT